MTEPQLPGTGDPDVGAAGSNAPDSSMPDLGGLMESFEKVQAARAAVYEGRAGGGAVIVRALGDGTFESIELSADVVQPGDVELLQDLVLAALHDLTANMAQAQQQAMGALGDLDLSGMLGGLQAPDPGTQP